MSGDRGYKLIAALISAAILLTGVGLSARGYYDGARALRHARYVTIASGVAESQMEQMRAACARGEGIEGGSLPDDSLADLPAASGRIRVTRYGSGSLRLVEIRVEWDEPPGDRRNIELSSLLPAAGEEQPRGDPR